MEEISISLWLKHSKKSDSNSAKGKRDEVAVFSIYTSATASGEDATLLFAASCQKTDEETSRWFTLFAADLTILSRNLPLVGEIVSAAGYDFAVKLRALYLGTGATAAKVSPAL